jgi:predicted dehydrogenase
MPLRCAVAGLNRGTHFVRMLAEHPLCEVVAICDDRPAKLAEFPGIQGFTAFDQMLEGVRPEIVAIVTPGPLHAAQSLAALEAGAHVLVETPNVYRIEEASAIVSSARTRGLRYMLAEDYVYMPWCRRLVERVASGAIGDVIGAAGEYTHDCRSFVFADETGAVVPFSRAADPGVKPLWRLTDLPPLAYSSHTLGPLLALMDDRCVSVAAVCGGRTQIAGAPVFPLEAAVMQTARGASISLTNGFILGHPMGFVYALYGTRGAVRVSDFGGPSALIATDDGGPSWRPLDLPWDLGWAGGTSHLQAVVDDFVGAVANGTTPLIDEARSMDFCLPGVLAHESALRGGERLQVPLY